MENKGYILVPDDMLEEALENGLEDDLFKSILILHEEHLTGEKKPQKGIVKMFYDLLVEQQKIPVDRRTQEIRDFCHIMGRDDIAEMAVDAVTSQNVVAWKAYVRKMALNHSAKEIAEEKEQRERDKINFEELWQKAMSRGLRGDDGE